MRPEESLSSFLEKDQVKGVSLRQFTATRVQSPERIKKRLKSAGV